MWRKKEPANRDLVPDRDQLNKMAVTLLSVSGVDFDHATQLEQALIGTFLFGMIHTHGMSRRLAPAEIHALALSVYNDSLHYTVSAAAQAAQECINATRPEYHPTMNQILHRGIDAYVQYSSGDVDALRKNLASILDQFRRPG